MRSSPTACRHLPDNWGISTDADGERDRFSIAAPQIEFHSTPLSPKVARSFSKLTQKPASIEFGSLHKSRKSGGEEASGGTSSSAAQLLRWRASRHRPTRSPSTCAIRAHTPLVLTGRGRECRALLVALLSGGILGNAAWNGRESGVGAYYSQGGAERCQAACPFTRNLCGLLCVGGGRELLLERLVRMRPSSGLLSGR